MGGSPVWFCQSRVKKSLMPFGPEPNNAIIKGYLHTMPPANHTLRTLERSFPSS